MTTGPGAGRLMDDVVASLPSSKGTYALLMRAEPGLIVPVDSLGDVRIESPWLVYIGSAMGPGGLRARLGRHIVGSPNRRWHVDHLRALAQPVEAWWIEGGERLECAWAAMLASRRGWRIEHPRFGSSDCGCPGHLIGAPGRPKFTGLLRPPGRQRLAVNRVRVPAKAAPNEQQPGSVRTTGPPSVDARQRRRAARG